MVPVCGFVSFFHTRVARGDVARPFSSFAALSPLRTLRRRWGFVFLRRRRSFYFSKVGFSMSKVDVMIKSDDRIIAQALRVCEAKQTLDRELATEPAPKPKTQRKAPIALKRKIKKVAKTSRAKHVAERTKRTQKPRTHSKPVAEPAGGPPAPSAPLIAWWPDLSEPPTPAPEPVEIAEHGASEDQHAPRIQTPWWSDNGRRAEVFAEMAARGIAPSSPEATTFFKEIEAHEQ